jgi:hypothetical protein
MLERQIDVPIALDRLLAAAQAQETDPSGSISISSNMSPTRAFSKIRRLDELDSIVDEATLKLRNTNLTPNSKSGLRANIEGSVNEISAERVFYGITLKPSVALSRHRTAMTLQKVFSTAFKEVTIHQGNFGLYDLNAVKDDGTTIPLPSPDAIAISEQGQITEVAEYTLCHSDKYFNKKGYTFQELQELLGEEVMSPEAYCTFIVTRNVWEERKKFNGIDRMRYHPQPYERGHFNSFMAQTVPAIYS